MEIKTVQKMEKLDTITLNHYEAVLIAAKWARMINAKRLGLIFQEVVMMHLPVQMLVQFVMNCAEGCCQRC